jgi:hypothetical protein
MPSNDSKLVSKKKMKMKMEDGKCEAFIGGGDEETEYEQPHFCLVNGIK